MTGTKTKAYRPIIYKTPKDTKDQKPYPNGIKVLFAALWQRWAVVSETAAGPTTSGEAFAKLTGLRSIADKLKTQYPGSPVPPAKSSKGNADNKAASEFQYLGGAAIKNSKTLRLDYMALRRAAEVVGLPVGLLILYTNLISQERRAEKFIAEGKANSKKEELLELVEKIERFAREARLIVEESSEDDEIFYDSFGPGEWENPRANISAPTPDEEAYLAKLEVLKRLRDSCKVGNEGETV